MTDRWESADQTADVQYKIGELSEVHRTYAVVRQSGTAARNPEFATVLVALGGQDGFSLDVASALTMYDNIDLLEAQRSILDLALTITDTEQLEKLSSINRVINKQLRANGVHSLR